MKLLKEISYRYLIAAITLFLLSLPLLYLGVQYIITETVDESLEHEKSWFLNKIKTAPTSELLDYNPNISFQKTDKLSKDQLTTETLFVEGDKEYVPHRVLRSTVELNNEKYIIHIKRSLVETQDMILSVMLVLVFFLVILLISLFYMNRAVSKKIWKPFNQTLESLKNFRVDDDKEMEILPVNITEFKELQNSILKLAKTNTQLFKAQKAFTENAAHELQTPIAVILANIDLMLQDPGLNAEQALHLENISLAGNKIKRLNKALLLLSRIENNSFVAVSKIDLNIITEESLKFREDIILSKDLQISKLLEAPFTVNMNKDLSEILIGNLIANAIRHSSAGGKILIESSKEHFTISNSALEGSLKEDKLFQRFQKQSNNPNSLGLGLEICRQICKISGLALQYEFLNDSHYFKIVKTNH